MQGLSLTRSPPSPANPWDSRNSFVVASYRASLANPRNSWKLALSGLRDIGRVSWKLEELTEGMATTPAGFCEADNHLLQIGSGGSGRRVGVFPAIAFT